MAITVGYTTTRVVVNTHELFEPGGSVHRWTTRVSQEMETSAKAFASPVNSKARRVRPRTGQLERSIKREVFADAGNIVHFAVWADAPHAKYVHEGTADNGYGYIYTSHGYANRAAVDSWIAGGQFQMEKGLHGFVMPLPGFSMLDTRRGPNMQYYLRVRGQRANPFLKYAYVVVSRRHPGLPKRNWSLE